MDRSNSNHSAAHAQQELRGNEYVDDRSGEYQQTNGVGHNPVEMSGNKKSQPDLYQVKNGGHNENIQSINTQAQDYSMQPEDRSRRSVESLISTGQDFRNPFGRRLPRFHLSERR